MGAIVDAIGSGLQTLGNAASDVVSGAGDVVSGAVNAAGNVVHDVGSAINQTVKDVIPGGWATVGAAALVAVGVTDPEILSAADNGTVTSGMLENAGYDPLSIATQVSTVPAETTAAVQTALESGVSASEAATTLTSGGTTALADTTAAAQAASAEQAALTQAQSLGLSSQQIDALGGAQNAISTVGSNGLDATIASANNTMATLNANSQMMGLSEQQIQALGGPQKAWDALNLGTDYGPTAASQANAIQQANATIAANPTEYAQYATTPTPYTPPTVSPGVQVASTDPSAGLSSLPGSTPIAPTDIQPSTITPGENGFNSAGTTWTDASGNTYPVENGATRIDISGVGTGGAEPTGVPGTGTGTGALSPVAPSEAITPAAGAASASQVTPVVADAAAQTVASSGLSGLQVAALGGTAAAAIAIASSGAPAAASAANNIISNGGATATGPAVPSTGTTNTGPVSPTTGTSTTVTPSTPSTPVAAPTTTPVAPTTTPTTPLSPVQQTTIPPGTSDVTGNSLGTPTNNPVTDTSGLTPAQIAALAAAGLLASNVLGGGATASNNGSYTTIPGSVMPLHIPTGLNPGWITDVPKYYQQGSPAQDQYYWGGHPYQGGDVFNPSLYNTLANAPTTPFGANYQQTSATPQQIIQAMQGVYPLLGTTSVNGPVAPAK